MKTTIKEGDVFYRSILYRGDKKPTISEVTVKSVGKKYFYLDGWQANKPIDLKTLKHTNKTYVQDSFQLYRTKEEINDIWEAIELTREIKKFFQYGPCSNLNLHQIRSIASILGIKNDTNEDQENQTTHEPDNLVPDTGKDN